jgi:ATP synthase protein I
MDKKKNVPDEKFRKKIEAKHKRMMRARARKKNSIWSNFGLFGVVGWSVMIPTVICTAIGVWLDKKYEGEISWTLTMLLVGIFLGCLNAWYWVQKERKNIEEEHKE